MSWGTCKDQEVGMPVAAAECFFVNASRKEVKDCLFSICTECMSRFE